MVKTLYFVLGQAGPKFLLWVGPGRAEIFTLGRARPEKSGPCRPLVYAYRGKEEADVIIKILAFFQLKLVGSKLVENELRILKILVIP